MAHAEHEMIRQSVDDAGTQEWLCPACGRHLLLSFPPNYRKVVLEHGDVWTPHVGNAGGVSVSAITVPPPADHRWTGNDEQALREWSQTIDPNDPSP